MKSCIHCSWYWSKETQDRSTESSWLKPWLIHAQSAYWNQVQKHQQLQKHHNSTATLITDQSCIHPLCWYWTTVGGAVSSFRGGGPSRSGRLVPVSESFLVPCFAKRSRNVQLRTSGENTRYSRNVSYQLGYFTYESPLHAPATIILANSSTGLPVDDT